MIQIGLISQMSGPRSTNGGASFKIVGTRNDADKETAPMTTSIFAVDAAVKAGGGTRAYVDGIAEPANVIDNRSRHPGQHSIPSTADGQTFQTQFGRHEPDVILDAVVLFVTQMKS
jgi:hypothetical protein